MSARIHLALGLVACAAPALAGDSDDAPPAVHAFETDAEREPRLATGGHCVLRNATIHSAVGPAALGDVLVRDGKIAAVGAVGPAEPGALELDLAGMHLAPGVVDCHSHMAIERGINEGTLSITCDVDISDAIDPEDIAIYRALAGGVTTARLLHGSANAIGGRHEVIKLKWGRTAAELRFPGAREGVKFALGENPKRPGGGRRGGDGRFPGTRMGVEAIFARAFPAAAAYAEEWGAFEAARAGGADPAPPRRDLRLEALSAVLSGALDVHAHCYRSDEILMLLRAGERYGFRVKTLQHVLEGYKVAKEILDHGAGASTFGDWWAYKIEAYDAIPHNAAFLDRAGVLTSVNSDDDEMVRRLWGEAAKSVRYARLDPVRALALVTLNPARQLGIDARVGSIEVGKDADLALFDGDPLSAKARVQWTMVDGEIEFERRDAFELDTRPPAARPLAEQAAEAADLYDPDGPPATALVGGTLHPVAAPAIERGTLVVQGGRIVRLGGPQTGVPVGALVVPCEGRHVWPGMIALGTSLGLFEIDQVGATVDVAEIGGNQPDVRAAAALHAASAHIPVTRQAGVTRAESGPESGGPLRGQSAVIGLAGDTWEELVLRETALLHLAYPPVANDAEKKEEGDEAKELAKLFEDARQYGRLAEEAREFGTPPPDFDPRLEALAPFARGERKIALHASNAQTILFALRFAEEQGLDCALYGAAEGWKVAEPIARSGFSCVVGPVLALPSSRYDPYDAAYANAAVLARAGVPLAIMAAERSNQRNLPFHAAMAVAFGLPYEEGLRAITLGAAEVLGLEAELGSLAVGKRADLVVTDGDLLEIATHVEAVYIDGASQSLATRQTELFERYRERFERLQR